MLRRRWIRLLESAGFDPLVSRTLHARYLAKPGVAVCEPQLYFLGLDPVPQEDDFLWADFAGRLRVPVQDVWPPHLVGNPAQTERLRRRYDGLMWRMGRPRFVDKAPVYTMMLDTLAALYPSAHLVHMIRDGRAVTNSVAYGFKYRSREGAWWGPRPREWRPQGFRLVFYLQPSIYQTAKQLSGWERSIVERAEQQYVGFPEYNRRVYRAYRRILPARADKEGCLFVDGDAAIADEGASVFADHVHFGSRGNRLVARHLSQVVERLILPEPTRR